MKTKKNQMRFSRSDRIFYAINYTLIALLCLVILYPLIFIVSSSFSSTKAVIEGRVLLWPVEFSLDGYEAVFRHRDIMTGFRNSLFYMVIGTLVSVSLTMVAAYPLSRSDMPLRNVFMALFAFTMFFSGGLIPSYINMKNLHLINSPLAMILPGAVGVSNMIIARTFIKSSIPHELLEAAQIDGCSDARYFFRIVLPLSHSVIAVLALYVAVGQWNSYFNALIYLNDRGRYPLQLFLREILVLNSIDTDLIYDEELAAARQGMADLLKYALVIVSVAPMMIIFPFVQKFFVKGVMIGSLKG